MPALLNPPQQEAIRYLDGPCLVLAGAGSGKTRVITHKIAHLVERCEMSPRNIAAITFTNKAAKEMQTRVGQLLGVKASKGLTVCTFHALGVQIVRQEAQHCGLKPQFSILDASDTVDIVAELAQTDKAHAKTLQWTISAWKSALVDPVAAVQLVQDEHTEEAARCYAEYQRTLRAYQAVDFDDLVNLPVWLFEHHEAVLARWRGKLRYLLVDEYQDTNRAQYLLLRHLAGERGAFTAVGDDDQAIYAWRGADVENLRLLQQDYAQLKVIKLEQNYRSTALILNAANTLIAHNTKLFEKRLWSEYANGEPIRIKTCITPEFEAEWISTHILAHKFERRTRFSDYAILYRGNHQARLLEQYLRSHNIPYAISGGQSFFERSEIKDVLAYLRLMLNPDDDLAFIRAVTTLRRGVGANTLEALGRYAGEHHISLFSASQTPAALSGISTQALKALQAFVAFLKKLTDQATREPAKDVLAQLLEITGMEAWFYQHLEAREAENKWRNVLDFTQWLGRKGESDEKNILELTQTVALISMLDKEDPDFDGVQLATLHASKGLEFKHVFLVGVEEGLLPHQNSLNEDKIEEERRLMYVGITRAERSLTLTWCERRKQAGQLQTCEISRFVSEMGMVLDSSAKDDKPVEKAEGKARFAQLRAMLEKPTNES